MATDQSFRTLLIKLGIKTDDWKAAVAQIKGQLSAIAADEKVKFAAQRKQAQQAVADAKASAAAQKVVTTELQNQVIQQKLQAAQQQAVAQAVRTRLAQEALVTKQIQNQTAQLRLQQAQQRAATPKGGAGGAEGGAAGGMLSKLGGAFTSMLGGSFAGNIAAGAFAGGGLALVLEKATEAMVKFAEKLHEVILESGPLSQIRAQFEQLAAMRNIHPEEFLERLRESTRGLVVDQKLLEIANMALKSNLHPTEEQIVSLTQNVTKLARASGKDVPEALQSLNRFLLTGRANAVAMRVGISQSEIKVRAFGAGLTDTERKLKEFNSSLAVFAAKAALINEPVVTVTERLQQLRTAFSNFLEDTVLALGKSQGMASFVGLIGDAVDVMKKAGGYGQQLGSILGGVFSVITEGLRLVGTTLSSTFDVANTLVNVLTQGFAKDSATQDGIQSTADRLSTLSGVLKTAAQAAILLKNAIAEIALRTKFSILEESKKMEQLALLVAPPGMNKQGLKERLGAHGVEDLHKQFEKELADMFAKEQADIMRLEGTAGGTATTAPNVFGTGTAGGGTNAPPDEKILAKIQQAKIQAIQAMSRETLARKKLELDEQKNMEEESYRKGEVALAEHVGRMKDIQAQLYAAEKKQINDAAKAQKDELAYKVAHDGKAPGEVPFDKAKIETETQTKLLNAQKQYNDQVRALDDKLIGDKQRTSQEQVAQQIALNEIRSKAELKTLDKDYKDGTTTTEEYINKREALLDQEFEDFKVLKNQELQYHEQTEAEKTKVSNEIEKKRSEMAAQKNALRQEAPDMELKRVNDQYQGQIRVTEQQIKLEELTGGKKGKGGFGAPGELSDQQKLISLYNSLNTELEKLLKTTDTGTDKWMKYTAEIIKNKEAVLQIKAEMGTFEGLMSTVFGQLGGAIAGLGGRGFSALGSGFGKAGQIFGADANFSQYASTRSELQTNSGAPMGVLQGLGSSFKDLMRGFGDSTKNLQNFSRALTDGMSSVGTFVQAMQGKGGALSSGVAGAAGGASIGGQVGGALEKMPGLFGMSTALAGPIGMAAGAAIGLVTGIFSGKAQKKAEAIAKSITDSFNKVIFSLNDGQTTLKDALTQTEALRQQAISQLSGKKGGQDQLNKILPQYDQTINQLKAQQAKVLKDFNENLAVLDAGKPYESEMSSIDGIVQKYKQYVDAGGDVTKANDFLKRSFSDLATDGIDKLNQDQQDAITNALSYNDLLVQRQQLLSSTSQEVFNLLGAGAPGRSQTRAQSTAQKIAQLETQKDLQLEQLNQEIATAGHKLQVEQQIFSLATTRIGLENQLIDLKNQQTDRDTANIVALQKVMTLLQGGMPSFAGLTTSGAIMQAIVAALGAPAGGAPAANDGATVVRGTGKGTNFGPRNTDGTDMYTNLRLRYAQGLGGYPGVSPSTR